MKRLIKILATAIALVATIAVHAQENADFTPEDVALLRQLACEENSERSQQEEPLTKTGISSLETPATNSLDFSDEAKDLESELQTEQNLQEFCADY